MIVYKRTDLGKEVVIIEDRVIESNDWTFVDNYMGENTLTLTALFPETSTVPDFSFDWFVEFEGKEYGLSSTRPTGVKDTSRLSYVYTLIFSGAERLLKARLFNDILLYTEDEMVGYSTTVSFHGTIKDLCYRLQRNFDSKFGIGVFVVDLNPEIGDVDIPYEEYKSVSYADATLWDVVGGIYDTFTLEWVLETVDGVHNLRIGYLSEEIEHIFEYGGESPQYGGGLSSATSTTSDTLRTRLIGVGGTQNIPINYYGLFDSEFMTDGEYTPIRGWYRNLMPKTFRMYLFGFNDKLNAESPSPRFVLPVNKEDITIDTFNDWNEAYKSYDNGIFKVINFDDECVSQPSLIDVDWDSLGTKPYAFKAYIKGYYDIGFTPMFSIDSPNVSKYGVIEGVLETNDLIMPSIAGVEREGIGRIDEVVECEIVDEVFVEEPFVEQNIDSKFITLQAQSSEPSSVTFDMQKDGAVGVDKITSRLRINIHNDIHHSSDVPDYPTSTTPSNPSQTVEPSSSNTGSQSASRPDYSSFYGRIKVERQNGQSWVNDLNTGGYGSLIAGEGKIEGGYYYCYGDTVVTFYHNFSTSEAKYRLTYESFAGHSDFSLFNGTFSGAIIPIEDKQTFSLWIKDIGFDLADDIYWSTEEAMVRFTTGLLAGEYDFMIVRRNGIPQVFKDTSKEGSYYRLELQRNDDDYEATGTYLPNSFMYAKKGDKFILHQLELPLEYLYYAEERYENYIRNELSKIDTENPVITFDLDNLFITSIFENTAEASKLKAGNKIRIRNKTMIDGEYVVLTINSITKTPSSTSVQ